MIIALMVAVLLIVRVSHTVLAQSADNATKNSMFSFSIVLPGIGSTGNKKPFRAQRILVIDVFDSQNKHVVTRVGKVTYNSEKEGFEGDVSMGNLQPGNYTLKVKTSSYLQKTVPGILLIKQGGGSYQIQQVTLTAGDFTEDNQITILDYNVLMGCYSDLAPAKKCNASVRDLADLNDDSMVNQFDYNLFLRAINSLSGA